MRMLDAWLKCYPSSHLPIPPKNELVQQMQQGMPLPHGPFKPQQTQPALSRTHRLSHMVLLSHSRHNLNCPEHIACPTWSFSLSHSRHNLNCPELTASTFWSFSLSHSRHNLNCPEHTASTFWSFSLHYNRHNLNCPEHTASPKLALSATADATWTFQSASSVVFVDQRMSTTAHL